MSGKMVLSSACHVIIWIAIMNFCVLPAKSGVQVGSWGGQGGKKWTYEPKGDISNIKVTYDDVIHSICFTSIDENGNLNKSTPPCKEAAKNAEINIDVKNEKINGISGTFDETDKCSKTITSLSFTTSSNKTYGPFGTVKGTTFSLMREDEGFTGFHGSSGWLLDSIGVSLGDSSLSTTEDVGPWGGPGGENRYDYIAKGKISRITIMDLFAVRYIIITSEDKNGVLDTSRNIGGGEQIPFLEAQIPFDIKNGERLVGLSGIVGTFRNQLVVTALRFHTNKNTSFGTVDVMEGTAFSYMAEENKYITGFYGRDDSLLHSIGIHVQAELDITLGQWGNITAGSPWSYHPNGNISHISITYKDAIYSVTFTSVNGNGTMENSKKIGRYTGKEKAEIDIDPKNEKLRGISGTVGEKKGQEVITSLTFFTDKNRTFGPFGTEMGSAFSVPLKYGFISGFHGRSSKWVHAIGLYVKPT